MDKVRKYVPAHTGGGMVSVVSNDYSHTYVAWPDYDTLRQQLAAALAERDELRALIDTPHTSEWFRAVRFEAAHQIKRWGASHDAGKAPHDWFWLIGYLAGKALHAAITVDDEKAKHHTISTGAALLNWFRAMTGDSNAMRPGIDGTAIAAGGEGDRHG